MMRKEITENEMEQVAGGTVLLSKDYMMVGFTTTRKSFKLKNCTYREARDFVEDMIEEKSSFTSAEFDQFVLDEFTKKGWI